MKLRKAVRYAQPSKSVHCNVGWGSEYEILYASRCFPLRLQTQTFLDAVGTSHLCHNLTLMRQHSYAPLGLSLATMRPEDNYARDNLVLLESEAA